MKAYNFGSYVQYILILWQLDVILPGVVTAFTSRSKATVTTFKKSDFMCCSAVNYSYDPHQNLVNQAQNMRMNILEMAKQNDFSSGLREIKQFFSMFESIHDSTLQSEILSILDGTMERFAGLAFSSQYPSIMSMDRKRVDAGLEALQFQMSSFPSPYNQVPRPSLLQALRAMSKIIAVDKHRLDSSSQWNISTEVAFRILQRLITGIGVRNGNGRVQRPLSDRDFNSLLNAVVNAGRMDVAHKIVALQERTPSAPALTPVTYSILLKGYGRLGDGNNVEMLIKKSEQNNIQPDIIMFNSILDALVNCNKIDHAQATFKNITQQVGKNAVTPNLRTYNTMLKGFAVIGDIDEAISLCDTMKTLHLWDSVTTNTLVKAAVTANNFEYAEYVLSQYASPQALRKAKVNLNTPRDHPNVEAYTQLLDGYAKAGCLDKAILMLQRMRSLQVTPNEYTYTCLIAGLARHGKFDAAMKMLDYMENSGVNVTVVTYNAFISALAEGMVHSMGDPTTVPSEARFVEQLVDLLRKMVSKGVNPSVVTVTTLLESFAKCSRPFISEANAIVERFEAAGSIPANNTKVNTAMLRVYGAAKDVKGALEVFRRIQNPDIIAVNAFLDAACRSGEIKVAFETYDYFFGENNQVSSSLNPDVITYSILISSLLRLNTLRSIRKVKDLYRDMRLRQIKPDFALVDILLTAMIRGGGVILQKSDVNFTLQVLKDSKSIELKSEELEQRRETVRTILIGRMSEVWKASDDRHNSKVTTNDDEEDELFRRKGWNKVDSGFRLWGGGTSITGNNEITRSRKEQSVDKFLESKGWNDVDSGFRLI
jgi:pentatricopeptide repeat protein